MRTVSNELKTALRLPIAELEYTMSDGVITLTGDDDLTGIEVIQQGHIGKTVMKEVRGTFTGGHDVLDKWFNVQIGGHLLDVVSKGTVTLTIATPCVVSLTAHGLSTGDVVRLSTTGALPTGLSAGVDYYVIKVNNDSFRLATTYENAFLGTAIATSGSQSGTHSLTYYPKTLGSTVEYVDFGDFKIVEVKVKEGSNESEFKGYDKMYEALQRYDLGLDFSVPRDLKYILDGMCTQLGWTLATTTFANDDIEFDNDPYTNQGLTYRQVLEDIAQASGSVVLFNDDNELELRSNYTVSLDTITGDDLTELKMQSVYGSVNTVVLSRMPQEDNIVAENNAEVIANGRKEIKIVNNIATDDDREAYITPIFNILDGLEYYPCELQATGVNWFEVGDYITIQDLSDNYKDILVTKIEVKNNSVYIESTTPVLSNTPYQYAGIIGQQIKNTEIKVDKQQGEIALLVEDTTSLTLSQQAITLTAQTALETAESNQDDISTLETDLAQLQLTVEGLELTVSTIGGNNLLRNSSGLKGSIEEWKESGIARNDGTIVSTNNVKNNTEAQVGIKINNQFIQQTVPTIIGESYTFYCRYYRTFATYLTVSGVVTNAELDGGVSEWHTFKYTFTATATNTTITIDTAGDNCILADMVLKSGDVTGWVQAPNEVYGNNYRFDKDGFVITSLTEPFKATLDEQSWTIEDTNASKVITQITRESATLTNAVVQDQLTVQRYENTTSAVRFIPVSTGVMVVVND